MKETPILDMLLVGLGITLIVLCIIVEWGEGVSLGTGSLVIGMVGLEATRIRDCIKKSCEER